MRKKILFLLFFAAFLVRFIGLNQSLWLDEATTARIAQQYNYGQILTQFSPNDFHPPLYYLFMKFWTNIFGYTEVALRMPSVLASLVTGYVIYKIVGLLGRSAPNPVWAQKDSRPHRDWNRALWGSAFFLFNPLVVYYSQEARMYAVITLLVTLIFWSVIKFKVQSSKFKISYVVLANVFIALALGTYYGSVFFVAALYGYLLLKKKFKLLIYLLPGTMIAGILLYPLFFTQLKNSGEVLQAIPNWSATLGKANLKNLVLFPIKFASGRMSWEPKIFYYAVAGAWTVFVSYSVMLNLPAGRQVYFRMGILKRVQDDKDSLRNDKVILYTLYLLPILLGFLISFYKPLLQYFRFIYVIPFMCMLLAIGASKKWQRATLIIGFAIFSLIYTYIPSFHREDWKGLVASLPSDTVCALPSSFDPLRYYNPKLITSDARSCATGNGDIIFVPYVADIYGFDYAKYFGQKKYSLTETVSFRGVSYEIWQKQP